ncbi:MAG: carboxypeptidase-like regulatory domain-containing protein [Flavisolibacter sp.]|nr:carboxypeptidase-like regulatory domain-containing protein [Flavisolibacter sp.]
MKHCLLQGKNSLFPNGLVRPPLKSLRFLFLIVFSSFSSFLFAQQIVTGRVMAGDTAVVGATVQVKGTSTTTQTDASGNFTISAPTNATLVISSVGYNSQEVKLGNRSSINVQLQSTTQQMSEVVVVGYGTLRRSDLTGSVSSVSAEKITQVKGVSTVAQALQGQAAGVQVFQRSGQPGEAVSIKVRGTNSIQASNDVLYVVEGGVF